MTRSSPPAAIRRTDRTGHRRRARLAALIAAIAVVCVSAFPVAAFAADKKAPAEPAANAGLIYVSPVAATVRPSLLPSGGTTTLTLTVRNLSPTKISGSVNFWITTPWGSVMSELPTAQVKNLKSGETRKLTAKLDGPGQLMFYTAHAEFTPPALLDKLKTPAQARQDFLFVPPLFALAGAVIITIGMAILLLWARRRSPEHTESLENANNGVGPLSADELVHA